jgi:hypothetical protein
MNDEQITGFVYKMLRTAIIADYRALLEIVEIRSHE